MNIKDLIKRGENDSDDMEAKHPAKDLQRSDQRMAYLGPRIWDKHVSLQEVDEAEEDFSVMNIDEFLEENNIQIGHEPHSKHHYSSHPPFNYRSMHSESRNHDSHGHNFQHTYTPQFSGNSSYHCPGVIVSKDSKSFPGYFKHDDYETDSSSPEADIQFPDEDLALATVPGIEFDPRARSFDVDELKPQPIIRKRPKIFVSESSKDDKYWEKRIKNNVAARRSREARRLKENQIALRASYLEQENTKLRQDLEESKFFNTKLIMERDILKQKLSRFEDHKSIGVI